MADCCTWAVSSHPRPCSDLCSVTRPSPCRGVSNFTLGVWGIGALLFGIAGPGSTRRIERYADTPSGAQVVECDREELLGGNARRRHYHIT
jgi:hypothetical protein